MWQQLGRQNYFILAKRIQERLMGMGYVNQVKRGYYAINETNIY